MPMYGRHLAYHADMAPSDLQALREWSGECRSLRHWDCQHIGSAGTLSLRGAKAYVTVCLCSCHRDCKAETVDLAQMKAVCTCLDDGQKRQRDAETWSITAPPSVLDRLLRRFKTWSQGRGNAADVCGLAD
jgi:hypothetical protein